MRYFLQWFVSSWCWTWCEGCTLLAGDVTWRACGKSSIAGHWLGKVFVEGDEGGVEPGKPFQGGRGDMVEYFVYACEEMRNGGN